MKDFPGYEGLYAVTDCGEVWSYLSNKWLSKCNHPGGYLYVSLCRSGKRNNFLIHRMVAITYIKNSRKLPHINHEDGNKKNNHYSNLSWTTALDNNLHKYRVLGYVTSQKQRRAVAATAIKYCSKKIAQYDSEMNFVKEYYSRKEAGRCVGCFGSNIARACDTGKMYYGYYWKNA